MTQQCQDRVRRDKHQVTLLHIQSKVRLEHSVLSEKPQFQERLKEINGNSDNKNGKKVKYSACNQKRQNKFGYPTLLKEMLKWKLTVITK